MCGFNSSYLFGITLHENILECGSSGRAFEIIANESSSVSHLIINPLGTITSFYVKYVCSSCSACSLSKCEDCAVKQRWHLSHQSKLVSLALLLSATSAPFEQLDLVFVWQQHRNIVLKISVMDPCVPEGASQEVVFPVMVPVTILICSKAIHTHLQTEENNIICDIIFPVSTTETLRILQQFSLLRPNTKDSDSAFNCHNMAYWLWYLY